MSEEFDWSEYSIQDFLNALHGGSNLEIQAPQSFDEVEKIMGERIHYCGHVNGSTSGIDAPMQVNFYELDLRGSSGLPDFRITKSGCIATDSWSDVSEELARVVDPRQQFANLNRAPFRDYNGARKAPLTQLSMLPPTPCPTRTAPVERCLYVFKIANPGNRIDCRFSRRLAPFSRADLHFAVNGTTYRTGQVLSLASVIASPAGNHDDRGKYASDWLVESRYPPRPDGDEYPESTWACMLFDWAGVSGGHQDFAIRFNIHVEMRDRVTNTFMPIIIDPDIGHPGGNQAGP